MFVIGDARSGEKEFFGLLKEIVELEYNSHCTIVLFRCDWYDVYDDQRGINKDQNGVITLNITRFL